MEKEYLIRKKNDEHAYVSTIYSSSISHNNIPDGAMKFSDEITARCIAKHCEKTNVTSYVVVVRSTTLTQLPDDTIETEE